MEWLDDLTAALPAPREDEPPGLRRKIIAELRDHLHAAMRREILLTGNAEQAQHNVLSRFGDPARLARKLWYDAMWEKIMTQRMMLAALVIVIVVGLGSTGLTWFLVVQAGQVNQALLEQNRAANELMLAKLAALGNAPGNSGKTMEWNSLKVQLSYEKPGGAAAADCKLELQGRLLDTSVPTSLSRTTGPDGVADFGLVRPGQHLLNIVTPWGESIDDRHDYGILVVQGGQVVTVLPGEPQTVEVICPAKSEEAEITISVDWPDDLAAQPLWLVCDFVQSPREIGGHAWTRNDDHGPQFVVVDPAGKLTNPDLRKSVGGPVRTSSFEFFPKGESFYQEEEERYYVKYSKTFVDSPGIYGYREPETRGYVHPRTGAPKPPHIWLPKSPAVLRLRWLAGTYSVANVAVGGETETGEESLPDDLLHPVFLGGVTFDSDDRGGVRLLYPDEQRASARRRNRRGTKLEIPKFEAVAGRLNEWRLSLPQPLVELLKEPKVEADADAPFDGDTAPVYIPLAPRPAQQFFPIPEDEDDTQRDENNSLRSHRNPRAEPEHGTTLDIPQ